MLDQYEFDNAGDFLVWEPISSIKVLIIIMNFVSDLSTVTKTILKRLHSYPMLPRLWSEKNSPEWRRKKPETCENTNNNTQLSAKKVLLIDKSNAAISSRIRRNLRGVPYWARENCVTQDYFSPKIKKQKIVSKWSFSPHWSSWPALLSVPMETKWV